jgi:hypothetical protein
MCDMVRDAKSIFGPLFKRKLGPPPPILQIMILKLSPRRCVISKESVQQKWIDEFWFRKQLSTCLFVWTLNYNSWAPGSCPGWPSLPVGLDMHKLVIYHSIFGTYFIYNRNFSKNLLQSQVLFDFNEKNKISTRGIKYDVILLFNYYYRM